MISGSDGVFTSTQAFAESIATCRTRLVAASCCRDPVRRPILRRRRRDVLGACSRIRATGSRRLSAETSRSNRRASRAPYRLRITRSPAPRFTDDRDRARSSSVPSSGAPERFAPPRVPYRRAPKHPNSRAGLNRAKRQRIVANLKQDEKRIRRPCSRERGRAIALRCSAFGHGPVRTRRANPRCNRLG